MTIEQILTNIRTAVYGRDVRSSIYDGVEKCYNERLPGGMNPVQDLNNFPSGLALFTTATLNKPFDSSFLLIAGGNSANSFQIAYDMSNNNPPYSRRKQSGTWGSWERL